MMSLLSYQYALMDRGEFTDSAHSPPFSPLLCWASIPTSSTPTLVFGKHSIAKRFQLAAQRLAFFEHAAAVGPFRRACGAGRSARRASCSDTSAASTRASPPSASPGTGANAAGMQLVDHPIEPAEGESVLGRLDRRPAEYRQRRDVHARPPHQPHRRRISPGRLGVVVAAEEDAIQPHRSGQVRHVLAAGSSWNG